MRALHRKGTRVARQNRGLGVEIERPVDVGEALKQPTAEEARPTRKEDPLVSHLVPKRFCLAKNVVEIVCGQRPLCHRLDLIIFADVNGDDQP